MGTEQFGTKELCVFFKKACLAKPKGALYTWTVLFMNHPASNEILSQAFQNVLDYAKC